MLIEGAGVVAHRSTPVPFFISYRYEKVIPHSYHRIAVRSMHPK